jgi:lyso-ornithine lipid O-acyltransferase
MTRAGLALRVAAQALAFLCLAPLQWLAVKRGGAVAGRLPVLFHRLFLRLFSIRVIQRGRPPTGRPTLVLANHVSWLDIPVLSSVAPLSFIAKSEIFGTFARLQRSVFIERARKSHTAEVNAQVAHRLAAGETILLFPEGTTADGNRMLPFRSSLVGAARTALAEPALGAIDLQPLTIAYLRRDGLPITRRDRPAIAWYGDMDLLPHLAGLLRGGPIDVLVIWGEPIRFDAVSDRKQATIEAEAAVRCSLAEARFAILSAGQTA